MPNDYVTLKVLCEELNALLAGMRIDKIYQPERFTVVLNLRPPSASRPSPLKLGGNTNLNLSAEPDRPGVFAADLNLANPAAAPAFCMLLRKHLSGGVIKGCRMLGADRIFELTISARNELGDLADFKLVAELMGRLGNLILVSPNGIILDAVKRVSPLSGTKTRAVLPGMRYNLPDGGSNIGMGRETLNEIAYRADGDGKRAFEAFLDISENRIYEPCVIDGDYFLYPYESICRGGQCSPVKYENLIEASAKCFLGRAKKDNLAELKKPLLAKLKTMQKRAKNALSKAEEKIKEAEGAESLKAEGELILSNLWRGENSQTASDAEKLFKQYKKLKRAKAAATEQIEDLKNRIFYLDSIHESLNLCASPADFEEIGREISISGEYVARKKNKPSAPLKFEVEGFAVHVGKNNLQNEELTFKKAARGDVWLHVKDAHGSHVVIFAENKPVPVEVLEKAAGLAAFYSAAREADKVAVDYTLIKFVKHHPNKALGMVTYSNQKTIFVRPSENSREAGR